MKKQTINPLIYKNAFVKSYHYGNTLEMTTSNGIKNQTIMTLPNKCYVNLETGEIKNFDTSAENRADNLKIVKNTMQKLRRLIAHNFDGGNNQLWITLTYRDDVTNYKKASTDYKLFLKNLRRKYNNLEYISVIEPQASGRWHFHVLLKSEAPLYIANKEISKAWGKGFTKTKRLKSSDKVGNYVIAYLSDLDLPTTTVEPTEKKFAKGARLYFYPKGIRIYRRSKGIKDPIVMTGLKKTILEANNIHNRAPNFAKHTTHKINDGEEVIYITEFYDHLDNKKAPVIKQPKANDDKCINN